MTRLHREIISRGTMLVLGGVLLWGSLKCFQTAQYLYEHPLISPNGRRTDGSLIVVVLAYLLLAVGGFFVIAGAVPTRFLERFIKPPKATLWENPSADNPRGLWR